MARERTFRFVMPVLMAVQFVPLLVLLKMPAVEVAA